MLPNEEGPFTYFAKIDKVYRKRCAEAVADYGFTPAEIVVLMFLSNNAGLNTSKDIARYRNISKGLVARAVDSLVKNEYLYVEKDAGDRRLGHLYLSEKSGEIVKKLQECKRKFWKDLQKDIPEEWIEIFLKAIHLMYDNVNSMSEAMKD